MHRKPQQQNERKTKTAQARAAAEGRGSSSGAARAAAARRFARGLPRWRPEAGKETACLPKKKKSPRERCVLPAHSGNSLRGTSSAVPAGYESSGAARVGAEGACPAAAAYGHRRSFREMRSLETRSVPNFVKTFAPFSSVSAQVST